ncbi:MAG: SufS family cysteine desulfurase [Clostridia bacterium]|nr:SufS family cysteine desulfurase [Clostridia bacterium]
MKIDSKWREYFPLIAKSNSAYLDSAATSQKPKNVIASSRVFYTKYNANTNRGAYDLAVNATKVYEDCRRAVAKFLNAKNATQIIFTKNATEASNLVAYSYGLDNLHAGDEVVLSIMEHHSSIVPWQKICKVTGATLKYMYTNSNYELEKHEIDSKITKNTKIVVISSISNVLGAINNVDYITKVAHKVGAVVIADISQSIAHSPFDVTKLDVDFALFSAHKMYGPQGIGVLYGKQHLLEKMSPFLMGGDMIEYVTEQTTTFAPLPNKFEAGTQNVAGAYGLKSAIEFIQNVGYKYISEYENNLGEYLYNQLKALPFVDVYAPSNKCNRSGVISFNIRGIHAHDVASILNSKGVCVRSGNHCAQPLVSYLKLDSTLRASIAIYNNSQDVDKLISALTETYNKFKKYIKE